MMMKARRQQRAPDVSDASKSYAGRTALSALVFTGIAGLQKASGFILLIAFTQVLTPSEYGEIALLTTVSGLLMLVMGLGLEPRIIFASMKFEDDRDEYLGTARNVSLIVPTSIGLIISAAIILLPVENRHTWAAECLGTCLLAAGTTYPYALFRAEQRIRAYCIVAVGILGVQITSRVVCVALMDLGSYGWSISSLISGLSALVFFFSQSKVEKKTEPTSPEWTTLRVLKDGAPLIPHYLSQWGLAVADRLVLTVFVSTAIIGQYAAIYQVAAVTNLVISEVNRALMPFYARKTIDDTKLTQLVKMHFLLICITHGGLLLIAASAVELLFAPDFQRYSAMLPILAVASLAYGFYLINMNCLTLVLGNTSLAPLISGIALITNLAANFVLIPVMGAWGAATATVVGYGSLAAGAWLMATRLDAVGPRRESTTPNQLWLLVFATVLSSLVSLWSDLYLIPVSMCCAASTALLLKMRPSSREQKNVQARKQ